MKHSHVAIALLAATLAVTLPCQTVQPPYAGVYLYTNLGSPAGVPGSFGGVVFKAGNPNKMLLSGGANGSAGAIYEVDVVRNIQGSITGFGLTPTLVASAPFNDGGLCYGPGGVLFFTTYSNNTLGQIKPGSSAPDRIDPLTPLGVQASTGACNFVPPNFPGAGQLKIASYSASTYYGFTVTPDANGTFDLTAANGPVAIVGSPEGILYVPPGSALIPDYQYVLITEYGFGSVALYQLDIDGNPVPASRTPFLTGLGGVEGACTDPITGDLIFSTYGSNSVVRVSGFGVCGSFNNYGTGISGQTGLPTISGGGCAGRGQVMSIDVSNGLPNAAGLFAVGFSANSIPVLNGTLLVDILNSYFHQLDNTGQWSLPLLLPTAPVWSGLNLYSQSFYLDPAASFGVSATNGLHTLVR